jgi:hypothetical protein
VTPGPLSATESDMPSRVRFADDFDADASGGMLQGVVEEICDHLREQFLVTQDRQFRS